ncbi:MAG: redoxin family protein [Bdellovibrionales bacterium]|nr:redoxin family protein [Bdellovibrionales bacterium]
MDSLFIKSFVAAFVVFALVAFFSFYQKTMPEVTLLSSSGSNYDDCEGKKRCLAVYLAPWCGHCRAAMPLVKEIQRKFKYNKSVGIKVVVGQDSIQNLNRYANEIGGMVLVDKDGKFYRGLGVSGVPYWAVWDQERLILETFSGRPSGGNTEKLVDYMINDQLSLGEYL